MERINEMLTTFILKSQKNDVLALCEKYKNGIILPEEQISEKVIPVKLDTDRLLEILTDLWNKDIEPVWVGIGIGEIKLRKNSVKMFGDDCYIINKNDDTPITIKTATLDELEYDCFELVNKYAHAMGLSIISKNNDTNPISFDIAKAIQETILETILDSFPDAGFELKFEETV